LREGELCADERLYVSNATLERRESVFFAQGLNCWVVSDYDLACRVLRDPVTYSSVDSGLQPLSDLDPSVAAVLQSGHPMKPFPFAEPQVHARVRRALSAALSRERIESITPVITDIADDLISGFPRECQVEIIMAYAHPLPMRAMCHMLGFPQSDWSQLAMLRDSWLQLHHHPTCTVQQQLRHARDLLALQHYIEGKLSHLDQLPSGSLVCELARPAAMEQEALASSDLIAAIIDLLVAGHLTVTRAIGSAIVQGLAHKGVLAEWASDAPKLAGAVEEVLRLDAPTQAVWRITSCATRLDSVELPEGARVLVHIGVANHDRSIFACPDQFDPGRVALKKHLTFGRGIHFCLGSTLARTEISIALTALARRLPGLSLAPSSIPKRDPTPRARGFRHVWVTWHD
jgi:cytochrome P450